MRSALYMLVQLTWGLPQSLAGAAVFAAHASSPHFRYHGAIATIWESRRALSLGPFIFVPASARPQSAPGGGVPLREGVDSRLLAHEYGHSIQSLVLGPLYLPLVGLPSLVWLNAPACARMRQRKGVSYYSFYTEQSANALASRILGAATPR